MTTTISKHFKAMLDTITFTEGTLGVSKNGYDLLFNYHTIEGWTEDCTFGHLGNKWLVDSGGYKSTGAGRYAFLSTTWWEMSKNEATNLGLKKLSVPNSYNGKSYDYNAPFTKSNQDYFGYKLLSSKVGENDLKNAEKSADEFSKMIQNKKLDCTWTSLARALNVGSKGCFEQAEPGKVINKTICGGSGCKSGAEEIWTVYTKALSKY
jgi:muramidase (phage lysozyme)